MAQTDSAYAVVCSRDNHLEKAVRKAPMSGVGSFNPSETDPTSALMMSETAGTLAFLRSKLDRDIQMALDVGAHSSPIPTPEQSTASVLDSIVHVAVEQRLADM